MWTKLENVNKVRLTLTKGAQQTYRHQQPLSPWLSWHTEHLLIVSSWIAIAHVVAWTIYMVR